MAQINLLPWREQQRQDKNKQFKKILLLSTLLGVLLAVMVWGYLYLMQSRQLAATAYLNERIVELDAAIANIEQAKQTQADLTAKRQKIESLYYQRILLPRIWHVVASSLPSSLYLTGFSQAEGVITLTGSAANASDVTRWVTQLTVSRWLQHAQLHYVKQAKSSQSSASLASVPTDQSRYPFEFMVTAVPIEVTQVAAVAQLEAKQVETSQIETSHVQASPVAAEQQVTP